MKIAVASNNGILLSGHPGKCRMFLVYNIGEDGIISVENRNNTYVKHDHHGNTEDCDCKQGHNNDNSNVHTRSQGHTHSHGHGGQNGRHEAVANAIKDCHYLICSSAGPALINDLASKKIEVVLTEDIPAQEAVLQFLSGRLATDPGRICSEHHH